MQSIVHVHMFGCVHLLLVDICSMTEGAQQALRRTIEIYSKTTRFALACNTSDKIIGTSLISTVPPVIVCKLCRLSSSPEAIQSRCAVLRYSKLTDAQILTRLLEVSDREKVEPELDDQSR